MGCIDSDELGGEEVSCASGVCYYGEGRGTHYGCTIQLMFYFITLIAFMIVLGGLPSFSFFPFRLGGRLFLAGALIDCLLSLLAPDNAAASLHEIRSGCDVMARRACFACVAVMV